MGRKPCDNGLKKGAWTPLEDQILIDYVNINGEGKWSKLSNQTGLERGGKSCRLRWLNYLRPNIKRGNISDDEEELIIRLHKLLGNRWCLIAGRLPGRTDNEIKNYWNTNLGKKVKHQSLLVPKQSSSTPTTFPPNNKGGMINMLHMNNNTDEAAAARSWNIYEEIKTEEEIKDGSFFSVDDVEIGQLWLSDELLDLDDFNTTMRSTFGQDFPDLEAAAYDHAADGELAQGTVVINK